jgi:toxin ParE1/3/4
MRLVISEDAEANLRGIVRFAAAKWGLPRARRYAEGARERLRGLGQYPELGPAADEVAPGLRRYSYISHNIFYRIGKRHIRIVRILHKRMRAEEYLR